MKHLGSKGEMGRVHEFLETLGLVQKFKKLGRNQKWVPRYTIVQVQVQIVLL